MSSQVTPPHAASGSNPFVALGLRYAKAFRARPAIAASLVAFVIVWLASSPARGEGIAVDVAEIVASAFEIALVDLVLLRFPHSAAPLPVRAPRTEASLVLGFYVLMLAALAVGFAIRPEVGRLEGPMLAHAVGWLAFACMVFAFAIAPILTFLVLRYKPSDLGLRLGGLVVVPPILVVRLLAWHAVTPAGLAPVVAIAIAAPGRVLLQLALVFVRAALPEELFYRGLMQPRLAAAIDDPVAAWLVTAALFGAAHLPRALTEASSPGRALAAALGVVPAGLVFGYAAWRTRSLAPALALHVVLDV